MKLRLSEDEMLALWRRRRGLEPLHNDCAVTRTDGIDIDAYLRDEMKGWYMNLLDIGEERMLSPRDIARLTAVRPVEAGVSRVALPDGCRRVLSVELTGFDSPAIVTTDVASPLVRAQGNPFARGARHRPVALVVSGGVMMLYTAPSAGVPRIERMMCVVEPDEGFYELDEAALSLIPGIEC